MFWTHMMYTSFFFIWKHLIGYMTITAKTNNLVSITKITKLKLEKKTFEELRFSWFFCPELFGYFKMSLRKVMKTFHVNLGQKSIKNFISWIII